MTQPLIVDTDRLGTASASLAAAAGEIPAMPPTLSVPGADPLSVAIAEGSEQIEAPMAALPGIKSEALTTARNVGAAGQRYASTDEALAAKAARHDFANPGAQGTDGGGPATSSTVGGAAGAAGALGSAGGFGSAGAASSAGAAGKAGGLGQMMGMPMQMAQQAGQIPAQLGQMAGAAPQSLMQGAQGAVQQVTQMAGQFGKPSGEGERTDELPPDPQRQPGEKRPGDQPTDTATVS